MFLRAVVPLDGRSAVTARPAGRPGGRTDAVSVANSPGGWQNGSNKGQLESRRPNREVVSLPNTPISPPPCLFSTQRTATESQIEFFKMLDKKIEEGPDYVEK